MCMIEPIPLRLRTPTYINRCGSKLNIFNDFSKMEIVYLSNTDINKILKS